MPIRMHNPQPADSEYWDTLRLLDEESAAEALSLMDRDLDLDPPHGNGAAGRSWYWGND